MARHKDLVCGMQVEEERAGGQSQYQGREYYFCYSGCKEKFDQEPEKYAGAGNQTAGDRVER
jgi:Cu+-exporting ATPase